MADWKGILGELRKLCGGSATGTVFITTEQNHSAMIIIESGAITGLGYHGKRGRAALELMPEVTGGTFNFNNGRVLKPLCNSDLPATGEILAFLEDGATTPLSSDSAVSEAAQSSPATPFVAPEFAMTILESALAEFMGPVASMVCNSFRDQIERAVDAEMLGSVIESIASNIANPAQAETYKQQMQQRLLG